MTPAFLPTINKRRDARIPLSSIPFPFVGVRSNGYLRFQYRLVDASVNGAQFCIPSWDIGREKLRVRDDVLFFLPLLVEEKVLENGKIVWIRDNQETDELACGVTIKGGSSANKYFQVRLEREGEFVFLRPVQLPDFRWFVVDALIHSAKEKKRQIQCLEKLIPQYQTLTFPQDHLFGNPSFSLPMIRDELSEQASQIEHLVENINKVLDPIQGIDQFLNFGILRPILVSDLCQRLFHHPFKETLAISLVEEMQNAEKAIFSDYNFLVLTAILILV